MIKANNGKEFIISATSQEERQEWIDSLQFVVTGDEKIVRKSLFL